MEALERPIPELRYIKAYRCTGDVDEIFDNMGGDQTPESSLLHDDDLLLYCALQEIQSDSAYTVAAVTAEWSYNLAARYKSDIAPLLDELSRAGINYLIVEYDDSDVSIDLVRFFKALRETREMETVKESDYVISEQNYNAHIFKL